MKTYTLSISTDDVAGALAALDGARIRRREMTAFACGLTFVCDANEARRTRKLCEKLGIECSSSRRGAARYAAAACAKIGAIVAIVVMIAAAIASQSFVTRVEVTGADDATASKIVALLRSGGIDGTMPKSSVDADAIARFVEDNVPEITLAEVSTRGNALVVGVVPATPTPSAAAKYDRIVAQEYAIVTRVAAFSGTAAVKPGDIVKPGDVLIEGTIDIGTAEEPQIVETGADGIVFATVFGTEKLYFAPQYIVSEETGRSHTSTQVIVCGKTLWSSGEDHGFEDWTARTTSTRIDGILPIEIRKTVYREVRRRYCDTDEAYVRRVTDEARERLLSEAEGAIVDEGVNVRQNGDFLVVEIYVQSERQIGRGEERP